MLTAAPGVGQARAATVGGGLAGVGLLFGLYGVARARRRKRHDAVAPAPVATSTGILVAPPPVADPPPPYGTLPGDPPGPSG